MRTSSGARVQIQHLSYGYLESELILKDFSLEIQPSEFVALLGPSGCGKSTLLKLLAHLTLPNSGILRVDTQGGDVTRGFVFQEPRLLPWLTVFENVRLPLRLSHAESHVIQAKTAAVLDQVGLTAIAHLFPEQLSGGMKMRVSLARALVGQPSLLLLDEPFAALDEPTRIQFQQELRTLWKEFKMTIVFVTHSIAEALVLANRVVVLSRPPAGILADEVIEHPLKVDQDLSSFEENHLQSASGLNSFGNLMQCGKAKEMDTQRWILAKKLSQLLSA